MLTSGYDFKLAALKLIDQGKINYDTKAEEYLPEFRDPVIVETTAEGDTIVKPAQKAATVKHLLNFSSGLFYPPVPGKLYALPALLLDKEPIMQWMISFPASFDVYM